MASISASTAISPASSTGSHMSRSGSSAVFRRWWRGSGPPKRQAGGGMATSSRVSSGCISPAPAPRSPCGSKLRNAWRHRMTPTTKLRRSMRCTNSCIQANSRVAANSASGCAAATSAGSPRPMATQRLGMQPRLLSLVGSSRAAMTSGGAPRTCLPPSCRRCLPCHSSPNTLWRQHGHCSAKAIGRPAGARFASLRSPTRKSWAKT